MYIVHTHEKNEQNVPYYKECSRHADCVSKATERASFHFNKELSQKQHVSIHNMDHNLNY